MSTVKEERINKVCSICKKPFSITAELKRILEGHNKHVSSLCRECRERAKVVISINPCPVCGKPYKLTGTVYDMYKRMGLIPPRRHRECIAYEKMILAEGERYEEEQDAPESNVPEDENTSNV